MTAVSPLDAYLARLPDDQRAALERVRSQVARLVPDAGESISYGIPTFKLGGRALLWYAGWKARCSIYPLTDSFLEAHAEELRGIGARREASTSRPMHQWRMPCWRR